MRGIFRLYRAFAPQLKRFWNLFLLAYLALFAAMVMNLLKPWPIKIVFDHVLPGGSGLPEKAKDWIGFIDSLASHDKLTLLAISCFAIVAIYGLEGLFTFTRKYFIAEAGERAINDIRQDAFGHLQMLEHRMDGSADLIVRLTSDIDALKLLLTQHSQTLANYFLTFVGVGVTMLLMNWKLTLSALAVAPPLYLLSLYFAVRVSRLTRRKRAKESALASLLQETVRSRGVVQAFGREDFEKRRFAEESEESLNATLERVRFSKGFGNSVEVIIAVGTALVVYVGASNVLEGSVSPGDLIVFISYLRDLYKPVGGLSELIIEFRGSQVSGERVAEILETEIKVADAPDAVEAPPFRGEVVFENVTFGYKTGRPILQDLSFTANPGQRIALIGSSGTGKSTIVNLLLRFHDPWKGRVLIDGEDIRRFSLKSLRGQISVVLQEPLLFRRTIRENIAY
ncbi:MAG TPA: ABC transporter ATP-binding protein, partial [Thermodesulfobacteriota bacterium]|nr:ABC transporter ATP-binding protein [Thermodesulfobacteriota bacterium]